MDENKISLIRNQTSKYIFNKNIGNKSKIFFIRPENRTKKFCEDKPQEEKYGKIKKVRMKEWVRELSLENAWKIYIGNWLRAATIDMEFSFIDVVVSECFWSSVLISLKPNSLFPVTTDSFAIIA